MDSSSKRWPGSARATAVIIRGCFKKMLLGIPETSVTLDPSRNKPILEIEHLGRLKFKVLVEEW